MQDNEKNPGGTIGINRSLNHGPTIVSLPSANIPSKELTAVAESIADKLSEVDKAFEVGTESYLINSYITEHFNSRGYMKSEDHFFCNEVEYILGGELSDRKNEKRVEMALKAMRFPINLAYLYSDAEKQAALAAAAQLMTPGAAAAATQAALASTWAYAEADNDVKLLWEGHSVPMVKDDSSWAIDLDSAIEEMDSRSLPKLSGMPNCLQISGQSLSTVGSAISFSSGKTENPAPVNKLIPFNIFCLNSSSYSIISAIFYLPS